MILGMPTSTFTLLHVLISMVAIATGVVAILGLWRARLLRAWTAIFLITTAGTSITGLLFHAVIFGPAQMVGVLSLALLALATWGLYFRELDGRWRWLYVASSVMALYLNVFVGVVQAFQKLPGLAALGSRAPYALAQMLVAAAFVAVGVIAVRRFDPELQAAK